MAQYGSKPRLAMCAKPHWLQRAGPVLQRTDGPRGCAHIGAHAGSPVPAPPRKTVMLRNTHAPRHFALRATALALASLLWMGLAHADPPTRVARLGYAEGDVSLSPAGAADWVQAGLNQPLTTGDHLWTDSNARAELQLGGTAIRLGARSNLPVLNLDDSIAQLQLSEGSLRLRVRSIGRQQRVEVDTPNLALVLSQAGDYRVDVDPDGNATTVRVQSGVAEAYGDGASYRISANQAFRFYGTGLAELESLADAPDDALDR